MHDLIKRTENLLEKYESKLHLAERELKRKKVLRQLGGMAEGNDEMLALLYQLGLEE